MNKNKNSFGGHIVGQTFGTSTTGKPRLNSLSLENTIEEAWRRLVHVVIECKDFRDLIPRYNRPHSISFWINHTGTSQGTNMILSSRISSTWLSSFETSRESFFMTINDTPETRKIFDGFVIEETTLKYSCCSSAKARAKIRTELACFKLRLKGFY